MLRTAVVILSMAMLTPMAVGTGPRACGLQHDTISIADVFYKPRAQKSYFGELTPLQRACALLMVASRRVKSPTLTNKMDHSISLGRGVRGGGIGR